MTGFHTAAIRSTVAGAAILALLVSAGPSFGGPLALDGAFAPVFADGVGFYGTSLDAVAVQPDGKVLAAGDFGTVNGLARTTMVRLNGDGSLDGTFTPPSLDGNVTDIAVQADGRIIIAGHFSDAGGQYRPNLARLESGGGLDVTYDPFGATGSPPMVFDIALQPDGRLIVAGTVAPWAGQPGWEGVARIGSDGARDAGFYASVDTEVLAVALQDDGKVIVTGAFSTVNGTARESVARVNGDGSVDTSFDIDSGPNGWVYGAVVQGDGKILVYGDFTQFDGAAHGGVARLNGDGSLDASFGAQAGAVPAVASLALMPDGRIVIGGSFDAVNGETVHNLAVLNGDGTLDALSLPPGGGADDYVSALFQNAGRQLIVAGRFAQVEGEARSCLARFDAELEAGDDLDGTVFDFPGDALNRVGLPWYGVNTASLGLMAAGTLFRMTTLGPPLDLRITYNSVSLDHAGLFGRGWRLAYESTLERSGRIVVLTRGSGRRVAYSTTGDLDAVVTSLELAAPSGESDRLVSYGSYYLLTERKTRNVLRYERVGTTDLYRLVSVSDRNGNALALSVDMPTGKIASITGPAARSVLLEYDGSNRCTRATLPDGREILFTYAAADLAGIAFWNGSTAGDSGSFAYDADGYMTAVDAAGRTAGFAWTDRAWASGKYVSSLVDSLGDTVSYGPVTQDGAKVARTGPDGAVTVFSSNGDKTEKVEDPLGALRTMSYAGNLPAAFQSPAGETWTFQYDERGNLARVTDASLHNYDYHYDAEDRLDWRKDPLGRTWWYQYDSAGNLTRVTSPLGGATVMSYDPQGRLVSQADPNGNTTSYGWDDYGNLRSVTDPLGGVTSFLYSANDAYTRCAQITDPRGKIKNLYYDDNGRLTRVSYGAEPAFADVVNTYDAFGQTQYRDENGGLTTVVRNDAGQIVQRTDPMGRVTAYEYDGENRLTAVVTSGGRRTERTYDDAGNLLRVTDPLSHYTERTYDEKSNLAAFKDENANTTHFTYDAHDRLITVRDPLDQVATHAYDAAGQTVSTVTARGLAVGVTYDGDGRVTGRDHGGVPTAAFTYDPAGNLLSATGAAGTTTYAYDERNMVTAIAYPDGTGAAFTYDAAGNIATVGYPGGLTVSYAYDDFCRVPLPARYRNGAGTEIMPGGEKPNHPVSISWGGGSIASQYDGAGNLTRETRSNGTVTDYGYNADQQVTSISHSSGAGFLSLAYAYDAWGNCSAFTTDSPLPAPLVEEHVTALYDQANQITSRGGVVYGHDADGNLLAAGSDLAASFDAENRLESLSRGGETRTYTYDAQGRRARTEGPGVVVHHYDHLGRLLFDTNGRGMLTAAYIYRGKKLAALRTGAGDLFFYHFDRLGSTVALTDAAGTVVGHFAYDPYGRKAVSGNPPGQPFTFVGALGVTDEGGGVYFMKSRFYDAGSGRFLSRDAEGFEGGSNLYLYAKADPVGFVDPAGRDGFDPENYENFGNYDYETDVAEGTLDTETMELPHYLKDGSISEETAKGIAKGADAAAEIYGMVPGSFGGNYLNAAREYRDRGVTFRFGYEVAKGTIGLMGPVGAAVNKGVDATELVATKVLVPAAQEAKGLVDRVRWTIVEGVYNIKSKMISDFQGMMRY